MTDRTTPAPETDTTNATSQSTECITAAALAHGDKCSRDDHAGLADVLEFKQPAKTTQPSAIPDVDPALRQKLIDLLSECTPKADQQRQERLKMQESYHRRYVDAVDAAHETHRALKAINSLLIPAVYVPPNESGLDMVNRDDLYALLSLVNGHLGRALEMASDSDGKG